MTVPLRLIDAHCHVNFRAYRDDAEAVIRRSLERGIGMITVGSQQDTSRSAVETAKRFDGVWAIVGLHPIHLFKTPVDEEENEFMSRAENFDVDFYRKLADESNGKVVGIGECGLDYFHVPAGASRDEFIERQKNQFRVQLDLARDVGLPVMIHSRDPRPEEAAGWPSPHDDILDILFEYAAADRSVAGDVHCFGGTWEQAERYLELGFHISFTGNITFPPRKRDLAAGLMTAPELARRVPLERLLVETDAPYLAPVPHRGERNEPAYVEFVAREIARLRGISFEELAAATLANTKRLFRLEQLP
jgi:TatD DNase family protein